MKFDSSLCWDRIAPAVAMTLLLVSCGGGGGGLATAPLPVSVSVYAGALRTPGSRDGVGGDAQFSQLGGLSDLAQDTAGNVYVADAGNNTIRKISADGTVTTVAGSAGQSGSADGTGAVARFHFPRGIAVDAGGNLYVSDSDNGTLRMISVQGVVTTIAGVAGQSASIDGDAASARLNQPGSLAIDGAGTIYVVSDNAVRKRAPDGTVTTFAGQAGPASPVGPVAGNAAESRFSQLFSVAVDSAGNVYVADSAARTIRKFDSRGQWLPFGPAANGVLSIPWPIDMSIDASGNLYVTSRGADGFRGAGTKYRSISKITPDGMSITVMAGVNGDTETLPVASVDGPVAIARFPDPFSIAAGPNGRIVVGELATAAVRLIDTNRGVVSTLAGGLGGGEIDGAAADSRFNEPAGLATGPDGTLYVADTGNSSVRAISTAGVVSTFRHDSNRPFDLAIGPNGGTIFGRAQFSGISSDLAPIYAVTQDGPAWLSPDIRQSVTAASIAKIAADAGGNLYAADGVAAGPNVVYRIVAYALDGTKRVLATDVKARALAVDAAGNVYFTSDRATVGVISPGAGATILAGRLDDYGDEDGAGQAARFRSLGWAMALDPAGNVYVADLTRIRRVTPQGVVSTIADLTKVQGAQPGYALNGVEYPKGLAWSNGALYVTVRNAVVKIAF